MVAIRQINDEKILEDFVINSDEEKVKLEAIKGITDVEILIKICKQNISDTISFAALNRIPVGEKRNFDDEMKTLNEKMRRSLKKGPYINTGNPIRMKPWGRFRRYD